MVSHLQRCDSWLSSLMKSTRAPARLSSALRMRRRMKELVSVCCLCSSARWLCPCVVFPAHESATAARIWPARYTARSSADPHCCIWRTAIPRASLAPSIASSPSLTAVNRLDLPLSSPSVTKPSSQARRGKMTWFSGDALFGVRPPGGAISLQSSAVKSLQTFIHSKCERLHVVHKNLYHICLKVYKMFK